MIENHLCVGRHPWRSNKPMSFNDVSRNCISVKKFPIIAQKPGRVLLILCFLKPFLGTLNLVLERFGKTSENSFKVFFELRFNFYLCNLFSFYYVFYDNVRVSSLLYLGTFRIVKVFY